MATRQVIQDTTTISGDEGTNTSNSVSLDEIEGLSIQIEGDADSTDLTLEIQAKVDSIDEWSGLDVLEVDLTSDKGDSTNNVILQYDVLDLERVRVKTTNNSPNSTDNKIIVQKTQQQ